MTAADTRRVARRLFLIQVLLNYRTMQGGGCLFALWPWLKRGEDLGQKVAAASGYANAHPVFASLAAGAMIRRLDDESASESGDSPWWSEFDQWRESLAGPLGVIGDALIWDRWKPLIFAGGAWLMLWNPTLLFWAIVAAICLLAYNIPLWALRVWGVRRGYELGTQVLEALRDVRFSHWRKRLSIAGAVLAGALTGVALHGGAQGVPARGTQFLVAFAVMLFGLRFRVSAGTAALVSIIAALAFPMFP